MYKALFDHSPNLVWVVTDNNSLAHVSQAVTDVLGWGEQALVGQPLTTIVPPSELDLVNAALAQVRAGEHGDRIEVEFRALAADTTRVWLSGSAINLSDESDIDGIVFNMRNVDHRRSYEEQLLRRALYDDLTGLPARALCIDRLDRILKLTSHDLIVNVVAINIDNFSVVNERVGFATADELLRQASHRMQANLPGDAVIGRLGGDEFLIASAGANSNRGNLVGAVTRAFAHPFEVGGNSIRLSASMGLVSASRDEAAADDIINKATAASMEAKRFGPGQAVAYSKPLDVRARHRVAMDSELRRAIDENELFLHYQPIIDTATGRVAGAEALVRWQHPTRGVIPPAEFITQAEETGMIVPIGHWVIDTAVRSVTAINREYGGSPLFCVVNLSERQLADHEFMPRVRGVLAGTGLDPKLLHFDITEQVLYPGPTAVGLRLDELRRLGIGLAIDDFGTGYSSIAALQRGQATHLKIDRSFIDRMSDDGGGLAAGINGLAMALNLTTIAEGVETDEQVDLLRRMGVAYSQGYIHSRPLPYTDFWEYLLATTSSLATDAEYVG